MSFIRVHHISAIYPRHNSLPHTLTESVVCSVTIPSINSIPSKSCFLFGNAVHISSGSWHLTVLGTVVRVSNQQPALDGGHDLLKQSDATFDSAEFVLHEG